ncbi:PH domain-containing protein [Flavobacterium sp. Sd200]|uniref:PH domain-containing protein n=1 Tax=Flavobacterium sp. Sd200 TaxID=2692211 RepID=UPI0013709405|nr:PH domain-containing protein [Flavobacterium sp. Sd200]MXN90392.1 PH domain-containing protein [Flavobacterium sp. Sd200]
MEQPFTNETIDTLQLPQYEEAVLKPIDSSYLTVIWVNIALVFGLIAIAAGAGFYFIDEMQPHWLGITIGYSVVLVLTIIVQVVSFKNKAYAFRAHDVIYRSGAIATTTTIIPYNRVQHVAQHEGLVARWLGLASIEVFTAGATGSDITIPGIEKEQAIAIKHLLVGKIQNQQANEE